MPPLGEEGKTTHNLTPDELNKRRADPVRKAKTDVADGGGLGLRLEWGANRLAVSSRADTKLPP